MSKKYYKNLEQKLNEGVLYDQQTDSFLFKFENDTDQETISLSDADLVLTQFKDNIYAYGYKFNIQCRGKYMTWLKNLTEEGLNDKDIDSFIENAVCQFNRKLGINNFKCIIYPDSSHNKLLQKIIRTINTFLNSGEVISYYEIVKNLASNDVLNKINKLDYSSLSKDVSLNKKSFIRNYLTINPLNCVKDLNNLQGSENILIVDDTNTTDETLNEALRAIHTINNKCNIYIFTLLNGNI